MAEGNYETGFLLSLGQSTLGTPTRKELTQFLLLFLY
jgi:hypothetical protein